MPKVYQLQLPAGVLPGTRAATYVSSYQKGRERLWKLAMEQAKLDLKLDRQDYIARRKLAEQLAQTIRDEMADTQKALDDLSSGSIDRAQAIAKRNVATQNATNKTNANFQNDWSLRTGTKNTTAVRGPSSSTRTGTGSGAGTPDPDAPPTPLPLPNAKQDSVATSLLDETLSSEARAAAQGVVFQPDANVRDIEAAIVAAQGNLQGAYSSLRSVPSEHQKNVAEWAVADQIYTQAARQLARSDGTFYQPDELRNLLRLQGSPAFQAQYENQIAAIHEISPLKADPSGRGSGGRSSGPSQTTSSGYTTNTSSRLRPNGTLQTVDPVLEEDVGDEAFRAELEARLIKLDADLAAVDMPEWERRDLLADARARYVQDFGFDRVRSPADAAANRAERRAPGPRQANTANYQQLLDRIESGGLAGLRSDLGLPAPAPSPLPTPSLPLPETGFAPIEPPGAPPMTTVEREAMGLPAPTEVAPEPAEDISVPNPRIKPKPLNPAQANAKARQQAMVAGAALVRDESALMAAAVKPWAKTVQQVWAAGNPDDLDSLEDQLIAAYPGDEQPEVLAYFHALRAKTIESTMATA